MGPLSIQPFGNIRYPAKRWPELVESMSERAGLDEIQRAQEIPVCTLDDLRAADGVLIGSPTRYGNMTAQMKQLIDSTAFRKGANSPPLRVNQRKSRAVAAAIIVAILAAATLLPLAPSSGFPGLPVCAFKGATGLPCPL